MQHQHDHAENRWQVARNIVMWAFLGIVLFFLAAEHRAHLFGVLPFLLLLACPFMHMFMHGSHGEHGKRRGEDSGHGEGHADGGEPRESKSQETEGRA